MRKEIFLSLSAVAGCATLFALLQAPTTRTSGANFLQVIDPIDSVFARYLAKHGKSYSTKEEYETRKAIFAAQLKTVTTHNSQNSVTYHLGMNQFSDMSSEEFAQMFLGDNGAEEVYPEAEVRQVKQAQAVVTPIDWRNKNIVGPVKNQGKCGSCWSFSTAGPIEEHYAIKYGKEVVLAEQQLVDCSWAYGNNGCNGGLFANGYAYVLDYGLELNASYPYVANDTLCTYDPTKVVVKITGTIAATRSAAGLKEALMNGPASISLHVGDSFRAYTSGIYNDATCETAVNHAVQSVGWGSDQASGLNYFIVRNSWGPTWGENGYIRIAETNTDLGICGMLYRVPMQPIIA
jgi:C1A family cysteine protease